MTILLRKEKSFLVTNNLAKVKIRARMGKGLLDCPTQLTLISILLYVHLYLSVVFHDNIKAASMINTTGKSCEGSDAQMIQQNVTLHCLTSKTVD